MYRDVTYECGCEAKGHNVAKYCMICGDPIMKQTIRTPYGDITLLPITPEDMEKMKQSLLSSLSSSSEDIHTEGCAER